MTINNKINISLINEIFYRQQNSNIAIRKMIFFITIRELNTIQHENSDYVILFIYFSDNKDDSSIKTLIERKIHFVKNLKINMLINNNIIVFENIVFDVKKKLVNIDNCDIIVLMKIRFRVVHVQQRSIHVKKTIVLSSRAQLIIAVHNLINDSAETTGLK